MKRSLLALGVIGAVTVAALGGFYFTRGKGGAKGPGSGLGRPPVPVEMVTVTPESLEEKLTAVGSILSNESVTIKPEVAGKIISIGFEEGQRVEKGTVLFELDSELLDAEYQEVKADYDFTDAQFRRAQKLKEDGVMPIEEYDNRLREYLNAKSRLNTLATKLRKHKITAPFSGKVGSRNVSIGDYVGIGEALVRIEDLSEVKVEFYVPQRYVQRIAVGQRVRVAVEPLPETYEGAIYFIDPRVDADTRSAVVRGKVPNPGEGLKPGMFCTASIIIEEKKNALLVPDEAVISRGDKKFLFVEKDGKAAIRPVRLGLSTEGRVEVLEGLKPRDRVVAAGSQKLFTGTPIVEYKPAGARRSGKKAGEAQQG